MNDEKDDIINYLKRLDRIGDKESKTVSKIKEACIKVSKYIVENNLMKYFPDYSHYSGTMINPKGVPIDENISREAALEFSKHVHESRIATEVLIERKKRRKNIP